MRESTIWNVPRTEQHVQPDWQSTITLTYPFPSTALPIECQPLFSTRPFCFRATLNYFEYAGKRWRLQGIEATLDLWKEKKPVLGPVLRTTSFSEHWTMLQECTTLILPLEKSSWTFHSSQRNRVQLKRSRHFEKLRWLFSKFSGVSPGTVLPRQAMAYAENAFTPSLVWQGSGDHQRRLRLLIESPKSSRALVLLG